jgi:hypothetical protein
MVLYYFTNAKNDIIVQTSKMEGKAWFVWKIIITRFSLQFQTIFNNNIHELTNGIIKEFVTKLVIEYHCTII